MEQELNKIEERYEKRKKQVIILFIIILLLSIASFIYLFIWEKNNISDGFDNNMDEGAEIGSKEKIEDWKDIPVSVHNPLQEIPNDVVILIVQNPDYSVPSDFNFTKREVVLEYISSCEKLSDLKGKVDCLDVYFLNNVPVLKSLLENCTDGNQVCLDTYYLEAAMYGGQSYCDIISTQSMKEECDAWK